MRDCGGRRVEEEAAGVLLRSPMMLLADMLGLGMRRRFWRMVV